MQQLDEAERIAPRYALVQQYRANVAFLMGDRARAIAALEKALEIEPDNALYKSNLARLKDTGTARAAAPAAPPPKRRARCEARATVIAITRAASATARPRAAAYCSPQRTVH
jgi:tetratricopeptide (TPR) repeat protein